MNLNTKVILITFADKKYGLTLQRIEKEIKRFHCFDEYFLLTEDDFDNDYRRKYKARFKDRGFGYWMWKSYFVRKFLSKINDDDILMYCDAGCTLNHQGENRMKEYIDLVKRKETGLLFFDQDNHASEWTKGDVFDFFGVYNNPDFTEASQLWGGVWIIKKTVKSIEFVNKLYEINHNHYGLLTDKTSIKLNLPNYIAHRHDQAVFSLLSRFYDCEIIPCYEVYPLNNDWNSMNKYPIWANRNKVMTKFQKTIHRLKFPLRFIRRFSQGYKIFA